MKFQAWVADRWARVSPKYTPRNNQPYPMVAALGLAGEVGEVIEHLKKHYRDGKHPGKALMFELGDVLHYLTVIASSYGWSLEQIQAANMKKLEARDRGEEVTL